MSSQKVDFIITTGTGTYTVPSDFLSLVSIEAIGGGGSGGSSAGGGGGGAYAMSNNIAIAPGQTLYYRVGVQGGSRGTNGTSRSWMNLTNAEPTSNTTGVLADGGALGSTANTTIGAIGGQSSNSIGVITFSGGSGGALGANSAASGGGGAAGPGGTGGNGSSGYSTSAGRGAGGGGASLLGPGFNATAGTATAGGTGGNGGNGIGGGAGATSSGAGTAGTALTGGGGGGMFGSGTFAGAAGGTGVPIWTATRGTYIGLSAGPGGGGAGGGGIGTTGGTGGFYGGAGGGFNTGLDPGQQGIIVFTYIGKSNFNQYQPYTGFNTTDPNTGNTQDLGQRYVTKSYLLDAYPNLVPGRTSPALYAWGNNGAGELGNQTTTNASSPTQIGSLTNWKQIASGSLTSSGFNSTGAIKNDGTLWFWGDNSQTQIFVNPAATAISSPIQMGALTNWKQVSICEYFLAVKTDGTLWGMGYNNNGQLGNGTNVNYSSPIQIGALTNWKQVVSSSGPSGDTSFAIKTDGTLWGWGRNAYGNLGNGTKVSYSSPIQIGSLTNWKQITAWNATTLAVKTDGTLWGWGNNIAGANGRNVFLPVAPRWLATGIVSWRCSFRSAAGFTLSGN